MAAEKKWNLQTFPSSSSLFGTSQSYTITCAGDNVFVNLNQADIILSLTIQGLTVGQTYGVLRPSVAWASQVQTTVQFIGPNGTDIINYTGYANRGVAGSVLEVLEYSYNKYNMYNTIEFLTPVTGLNNVTFDVLIPMKFLADIAYDAQLLNIDLITTTITWEQVNKIFSLPSSSVTVAVNKIDIKYPTIATTSAELIPRPIREIPNRQIYIQQQDLLAGANSINASIGVSFPASVMYYFFIPQNSSVYNLNPNPNSVVTTHQLSSMGSVFPLVSNYGAILTPTIDVGLIRHYMELMDIIGKDRPEHDTILTFENWRDIHRIYSIEIGVEQHNGQQFNFQSTFTTSTVVASTCIMVFLGRKNL